MLSDRLITCATAALLRISGLCIIGEAKGKSDALLFLMDYLRTDVVDGGGLVACRFSTQFERLFMLTQGSRALRGPWAARSNEHDEENPSRERFCGTIPAADAHQPREHSQRFSVPRLLLPSPSG